MNGGAGIDGHGERSPTSNADPVSLTPAELGRWLPQAPRLLGAAGASLPGLDGSPREPQDSATV